MSKTIYVRGGPFISLTTLIFIVLLVLKLVGVMPVAGLSWIWITAPLWIGFAVFLAVCLFVFLVALVLGFLH